MRPSRPLLLLVVALVAGLLATFAGGSSSGRSSDERAGRGERTAGGAPALAGTARGGAPVAAPGDGAPLVVRGVVSSDPPSIVPVDPRFPPDAGGDDAAAGGFGMAFGGVWERFPSEPAHGPARLHVRVEDALGAPVPGATVILGASEVLGRSPVSWERLRALGPTGPDGTYTAEHLLEGRGVVTAEYAARMSTDGGLDVRPAVPVELRGSALHTATVRLPFALASLGTVEGLVRDSTGRPVVSAHVAVGWNEVTTRAEGTFRLVGVPSGRVRVKADATGHVAVAVDVDVPPRGTATLDLALEHEERGPLVLSGVVRDASDAAVPGARVFLGQDFLDGGGYTLRQVVSDEAGRYRFESLPERFRTHTANVQVHAEGHPFFARQLVGGLPSGEVELRLRPKQVRLKLVVLDARSGQPITSCLAEVFRPGEREPYTLIATSAADGQYETWVEAGKVELAVEAPDHAAEDVELDVGAPGGTFTHTSRLEPTTDEPAVEVDLTVIVADSVGKPVADAKIALLDRAGFRLFTLERRAADGRYRLAARSGARRLRVSAPGHETVDRPLELLRSPRTQEVDVRLP